MTDPLDRFRPRTLAEAIALHGDCGSFEPLVARPAEPTDAAIGSEEKIEVLAARVRNGEPLWHPSDNDDAGATTSRERLPRGRGALQIVYQTPRIEG